MVIARPENAAQARLTTLLRDSGPCSRAQLREWSRLSRSRLADELARLAELGLVEPAGLAASRGGRRSSLVTLCSSLRFAGIDVGATSVDVVVTGPHLDVLGRASDTIDVARGPHVVLRRALALLAGLREQGLAPELHGVGIGLPGPVSFPDGVPVAPSLMPGWDQFPVRETLSRELGCPVLVDNDVDIMALGEAHAGVARAVDDFLLVKIGTGVGCGIVLAGTVYRGANGSAGDIGHISVADVDDQGPMCSCGNTGCLEAYVGGAALARDARAAADSGQSAVLAARLAAAGRLSAVDVGEAAAAGDQVSMRLIREGGRRLGHVLASLVSFVNPRLVVIGGGVAGLGHALLAEVRSAVYRRSLPLATENLLIVASELGGDAGVIGATRLISDHVLSAA